MRLGLYYLNDLIDIIELSSKQYAKKRFLECIEVKEVEQMETIDIEPKWINLYPLFCRFIEDGTKTQKELLKKELKKLCKCADIVRQTQKEVKQT